MSLFATDEINSPAAQPLWNSQLLFVSAGTAEFTVTKRDTQSEKTSINCNSFEEGFSTMLANLTSGKHAATSSYSSIKAVGHRVVHGGTKYTDSVVIDEHVVDNLKQYLELAPDHQPANLQGISAARHAIPDAVQIAVFDTAFHHGMPERARVYAGPYEWYEKQGIRRFGFHGISHKYCSTRAAQILNTDLKEIRMITCHLGAGASLAAIKNGISVMTTMGYTPLEGLVMKTRSGSIDPGILLHLLRTQAYTADQLDEILNKQSGIKGISGLSGDMRELLKAAGGGNQRAKLALDMFTDSVAGHIGALIPILGGLDALVFTAGIGENSPEARSLICMQLEFLGLRLDQKQNENIVDDLVISQAQSQVKCLVVHTREELLIARECARLKS